MLETVHIGARSLDIVLHEPLGFHKKYHSKAVHRDLFKGVDIYHLQYYIIHNCQRVGGGWGGLQRNRIGRCWRLFMYEYF